MHWPTLRPFGRPASGAAGDQDPFTALRREMERLFESFGREIGWPTPEGRPAARAPSIDISETENELKIEADLPGVDQKESPSITWCSSRAPAISMPRWMSASVRLHQKRRSFAVAGPRLVK